MTVAQSAPRRFPGWLRVTLYGAWFFACLVVSFYATFPLDFLKQPILDGAERALGKGKQGRYGVDPKVEIVDMSLWGGTGVSLERVKVQLGSTDPDPGAEIDIDELNVRVGLFSLLFGSPTLEVDAKLYQGNASGSVSLAGGKAYEDKAFGDLRALLDGKAENVRSLDLDIEDVDLGKAPFVVKKAGVPVTGVLGGTVSLDMGDKPSEEAKGAVNLAVKGINLGPGELEIPVPGLTGGLTVPLIDLGDLEAKIKLDKGKGKTQKLGLNGRDVSADVDLDLDMSPKLSMSRVSGKGWFKIAPEFLEQNAKFKTILDFAQPLKAARDDDGRYQFHLRGTLSRPGFKLGEEKSRGSRRGRR